MDDEKFKNFVATFSEQFVTLAGQLAELRSAVTVMKIYAATQLSPDDPAEALKQFLNLEKILLERDSNEQERKATAELIEAVKLMRKHGGKHEA
jgi:RecB family exonuclease